MLSKFMFGMFFILVVCLAGSAFAAVSRHVKETVASGYFDFGDITIDQNGNIVFNNGGCKLGQTSIAVHQGTERQQNSNLTPQKTFVYFHSAEVDFCLPPVGQYGGTPIFDVATVDSNDNQVAFAILDRDVVFAKDLSSATVNTTITLFDKVSQKNIQVHINLTWTGHDVVERQFHEIINDPTTFPPIKFMEHGDAKSTQEAEVTGTITVGSLNTNVAAFPLNEFAFISFIKDGTVFIQIKPK